MPICNNSGVNHIFVYGVMYEQKDRKTKLWVIRYKHIYQRNLGKDYEKRLPITSYLSYIILFNTVAQWKNAQIKMLIE